MLVETVVDDGMDLSATGVFCVATAASGGCGVFIT